MIYWEDIGSDFDWVMRQDGSEFIPLEFTGLKDKNGKEIYEGDVVKGGVIGELVEIYWRNGGFGIKNQFTKDNPDSITFIDLEACEVIGNIYENPELLERRAA